MYDYHFQVFANFFGSSSLKRVKKNTFSRLKASWHVPEAVFICTSKDGTASTANSVRVLFD